MANLPGGAPGVVLLRKTTPEKRFRLRSGSGQESSKTMPKRCLRLRLPRRKRQNQPLNPTVAVTARSMLTAAGAPLRLPITTIATTPVATITTTTTTAAAEVAAKR